jgi:hypothetical protein
MIVSDAPNCGITYDCHYDDRNNFTIQAKDRQSILIKKSTSTFILGSDKVSKD